MKNFSRTLTCLFILGCWLATNANAQKGPSPGMNFKIFYGAEAFTHPDKIYQIQSNNLEFSEVDTIGKLGKFESDFSCFDNNNCISNSRGYKKYQKLTFVYLGKGVDSEIFSPTGFISDYEVRMSEKGISITNQTPFFYQNTGVPAYLKNLVITIIAELLFSLIILRIFNYSNTRDFIKFLVPANILSLSVFWWIIMPNFNSAIGYLIGEVFMIIIESVIIWFGIKREIPFGKNMSILFFVNLMGLIAGGFLKFIGYFGIATRIFW